MDLELLKHSRKKTTTAGRLALANLKSYNKTTVTQTAWNWWKDMYTNQENIMVNPEINPPQDGHRFLTKMQK